MKQLRLKLLSICLPCEITIERAQRDVERWKAETKKKRETKQQDLHFLFRRTVNAKPRNSLCVTRVVKKKRRKKQIRVCVAVETRRDG